MVAWSQDSNNLIPLIKPVIEGNILAQLSKPDSVTP